MHVVRPDGGVSGSAAGTSRRALLSDDEEAWTAPTTPAHVTLRFPSPVTAQRLALTFQGGFVATSTALSARKEGEEERTTLGKVYPEDVNRRQLFDITLENAVELRLDLETTSDNQGRVTLYRIELLA